MTRAPTVCLDFDDTLSAPDGSPLPGCREALERVRATGARLVLSSARFSPIYGELNRHRMERVRGWLDEHGLPVDSVCLFVPRAEVYVDDLAYRFGGDWSAELPSILDLAYPAWRSPLTRAARPGRPHARVSIDLEAAWSSADDAPRAGAVQALAELERRGLEVVLSAGPHLGLTPEAVEAPATRPLRERLAAAGLRVAQVHTQKVSSQVYVSAGGLRHDGDWQRTAAQLLALLGAPG